MISIIICSKSPSLFKAVSDNIKETIGVPYEIIGIDNSEGKYGICKAYNLGAAKAQYDIFCFAHEDILFVTQNWGANVINHLKDERVGLIGTLGAYPTLKIPSCFLAEVCMVEANYIDVNIETNISRQVFATVNDIDKSLIKEVTAVDGVLLITRRSVYEEFQFDDKLLTGFHGYDVEYSLQVRTKYKTCVVFDLKIKHFFTGGLNKQYINEMILVSKKWEHILPISVIMYTHNDFANYHWLAMARFIELIVEFNYSWSFIFRQYLYFSFNKYFRVKPFLAIIIKIILPKFFQKVKHTIYH